MWDASAGGHPYQGFADAPLDLRGRAEPLIEPQRVPGPGQARAAEERGAAMSLPNAAEYAVLLTLPGLEQPQARHRARASSANRNGSLSPWSPQGRTNAPIAAQPYISVRTVSKHLDRIRDKTGCRVTSGSSSRNRRSAPAASPCLPVQCATFRLVVRVAG